MPRVAELKNMIALTCPVASTALLTRTSLTRRLWTRAASSIEVGLPFVKYNLGLFGNGRYYTTRPAYIPIIQNNSPVSQLGKGPSNTMALRGVTGCCPALVNARRWSLSRSVVFYTWEVTSSQNVQSGHTGAEHPGQVGLEGVPCRYVTPRGQTEPTHGSG
jgi:hypothetical protein